MSNIRTSSHHKLLLNAVLLVVMMALLSGALTAQDSVLRQFATVERVNMSTQLAQSANGQFPTLNETGRYVIFWSDDNKLIANDTNNTGDIFLRDRQLNETVRVSIGNGNVEPNNLTFPENDISDNGTLIVYASNATNLISGDTNGQTDVFIFDRGQGAVTRASVTYNGQQGNAASFRPVISGNGRFVAFRSFANNIVPNDLNNQPDIFLFDRAAAPGTQLSQVNLSNTGAQSNLEDSTDRFAINEDGTKIVFASRANNLVTGDTNGFTDIFLRDRTNNTTTRISIGLNGTQANGHSGAPAISNNGRYIAFRSDASNLVEGDTNGRADIFLYDLQLSTMTRVSVARDGTQGNGNSDWPNLNNNGRFISFWSDSNNFTPDDANNTGDIFVHDRVTGVTTRINIALNGAQANGPTARVHGLSGDAAFAGFESLANNLVANDTNNSNDIFVAKAGPNNPTNLTITDVTANSVKLTWQDNANDETKYEVERKRGAGLFQIISGALPPNTTTYTDTSLKSCTRYTYWVFAGNATARAGSEVVSVKTKGCPPGEFALKIPLDRLIINVDTFRRFRWDASTEAVTYKLEISRVEPAAAEVLDITLNAVDICTENRCDYPVDDTLRASLSNGSYEWRVTATNPVGETTASNNPGRFRVDDTLPPRVFNLVSPIDGALVRSGSDVATLTWDNNIDAVNYDFHLIKISNNPQDTRLGQLIALTDLTPQEDADALTCPEDGKCTLTLTQPQQDSLNTGLYSWTVLAESPSGAQSEATNGALLFRINTGNINFVKNGSFEEFDPTTRLPTGWKSKKLTADFVRCNKERPNKPPKIFAQSGNCAFVFQGTAGENAQISQLVANSDLLIQGDTLTFTGYLQGKAHVGGGRVTMWVYYENASLDPDNVSKVIKAGTYDYEKFSGTVTIDGPVDRVKIIARYKGKSGSVRLDNLSVVLEQEAALIMPETPDNGSGLIPLPAAPADGSN